MSRIEFEISEDLHTEIAEIANETGLSIEDIAKNAVESFVYRARSVREEDLDERDEKIHSPTGLDGSAWMDERVAALEGTEPWLDTEGDPASMTTKE